jgi:hypothetical protein
VAQQLPPPGVQRDKLTARANRYGPELKTHDRFGNRVDEVAFDPSWHELMRLAMSEGEHAHLTGEIEDVRAALTWFAAVSLIHPLIF